MRVCLFSYKNDVCVCSIEQPSILLTPPSILLSPPILLPSSSPPSTLPHLPSHSPPILLPSSSLPLPSSSPPLAVLFLQIAAAIAEHEVATQNKGRLSRMKQAQLEFLAELKAQRTGKWEVCVRVCVRVFVHACMCACVSKVYNAMLTGSLFVSTCVCSE